MDKSLRDKALEQYDELYRKVAFKQISVWEFTNEVRALFLATLEQFGELAIRESAIQEVFEKIEEQACVFATTGKNESYREGYVDAVMEYDSRILDVARQYGLKQEGEENEERTECRD